MSGGDDFRTQYRDFGIGESDPPIESTRPPSMVVLDLVRQHTPKLVQTWLNDAIEKYEKEQEVRRERRRKEEIERLKKVAEEGDRAKARIRELESE